MRYAVGSTLSAKETNHQYLKNSKKKKIYLIADIKRKRTQKMEKFYCPILRKGMIGLDDYCLLRFVGGKNRPCYSSIDFHKKMV